MSTDNNESVVSPSMIIIKNKRCSTANIKKEYLDEYKKMQKEIGLAVQGEPIRTSIPAKQVVQ